MKPLLPATARVGSADLARRVLQFRSRLKTAQDISAEDVREIVDLLARAVETLDSFEQEMRERAARIDVHQSLMDKRLLGIETSRLARAASTVLTTSTRLRDRIGSLLHRNNSTRGALSQTYREWLRIARERIPSRGEQSNRIRAWKTLPKISILMAVDANRSQWLSAALTSIEQQSYEHWELCLVVDAQSASADPLLSGFHRRTGRLRVIENAPGAPHTEGFERAAQAASGDHISFLDPADTLAEAALFCIAERLQTAPDALIYTDQDLIDDAGLHLLPVLKPDWSPRLAAGCAYTGGVVVAPRAVCLEGLASNCQRGSEPHHLLRAATSQHPVEHIASILYHERARPDWMTAERVLPRSATASICGTAQEMPTRAVVDIVICSRTASLVRRCINAVRSTTPAGAVEITVVHHVLEAGTSFEGLGATRILPYEGSFNFSLMNNLGVSAGAAPIVLLLNDDVIATASGWLERLIAPLQDHTVAITGAVLRYPDGTLQHAGIVTGVGDGAGHVGRFTRSSDLWPWLTMTREVSGVTGACLAMRREVWNELGGLDPAFPNNYNDLDLCLRAWQSDYRVVCIAELALIHEECRTRKGLTHLPERDLLYARWPAVFSRTDPFYSSSLSPTDNICLAFD
jgi:GT2 family glycosyltransferase